MWQEDSEVDFDEVEYELFLEEIRAEIDREDKKREVTEELQYLFKGWSRALKPSELVGIRFVREVWLGRRRAVLTVTHHVVVNIAPSKAHAADAEN